MTAKKYTLFKADGTNGKPPPCAFFLSPKGCKNGDKCRFSHDIPAEQQSAQASAPAAIVDDSSDVVSSESEAEAPQCIPIATKKSAKETAKGKTEKTPKESKKKRKRSQEVAQMDLGLFSKPAKRVNSGDQQKKDAGATPSPKKATPSKPKPITPKTSAPKQTEAVPSFRALDLPIASFSTDGKVAPPKKNTPKEATQNEYPIPHSTPEGKKWQSAVLATRANPKYQSIFDYEKMKKADEKAGVFKAEDWVKAKPFGPWCAQNPHAIAIDCEMCETKHPETGVSDHKALCRLSVVSAIDHSDVLIDTLVKPDWPVVDYRSRINGIGKEDLENVQFTLRHAQAFMMALCSEETVIIGHAVHNDIAALKMDHHCNVDSALLFSCKDDPNATCSLKDLAKSVMGKEMPDIHCSVNDARTALISLEDGYLKKNGKPDPVVRTPKKGSGVGLFVHRIPKGCQPEHIKNMFLTYTSIQPEEIDDIIFGKDTGKTVVKFTSVEHANLAFKTLENEAKPDKTGRLQKRIYMRNGDYTYVRKMTNEKKRPSLDGKDKNPSS